MPKKLKPIDLSHTAKFVNKWVCLDEQNRVCGVGKTAKEALQEATNRGYVMPTLMFVSDWTHISHF